MKDCDDYIASIQVYLDKRLSGGDLEDFRAHLEECEACRTELETEERLSALLRRSRPLYVASDALRKRVFQATELHPATTRYALVQLGQFIAAFLAPKRQSASHRTRNWGAFLAAILLLCASLLLVHGILRRSSADSYIEAAIAAHRSFLDGSLPLKIQSDSPNVVSAWFAGKVPFTFHLPSSEEKSGHPQVCRLAGGLLVNYKGGYVALVAYQMKQEKISLLVSSSRSAVAAGGEEVSSGGIVFHYRRQASFNIITWSNHGLTYALVSSLPGSGRPSCLVCHQDMEDGANF
jgi:mycothiol system anti-sigma-R factor